MKKLICLLCLPMVAGCLSSSVPMVSQWPLEYKSENSPSKTPKYASARLAQMTVRSPYSSPSICVRRANGTIAFDPYNEYAATPALLLKGAAQEALARSGMFGAVVGASSSAAVEISAEVTLLKMSLDCSENEDRVAAVEVRLMLLKGRDILSITEGKGSANAASGDFGAAFSAAFSSAMEAAISKAR